MDLSRVLDSGWGSDLRLEIVVAGARDPDTPCTGDKRQRIRWLQRIGWLRSATPPSADDPTTRKRRAAAVAADTAADADNAAADATEGAAEPAAGGGAAAGAASAPWCTMRLHSLVLIGASKWAEAMLLGGEFEEGRSRELRLEVADESEAAAAQLVMRALYQPVPVRELDGLDQAALLQVLRLADRLQVPRCIEAAGQALMAAEPLDWGLALAVYALPAGCRKLAAYAPAFRAAAAAVHARLGDIDAALADEGRRRELLALPLAALAALLRSDETCASGEEMVYLAADEWLHARGGGSEEERAALAECIRCHHLLPSYIAAVASASPWLPHDERLRTAAVYAALPKFMQQQLVSAPSAVTASFTQPRHPPSAVRSGELVWDVPVSALQALHAEAVAAGLGQGADASGCIAIAGSSDAGDPPLMLRWGGYRWYLNLRAAHTEEGVVTGLHVAILPPPCSEAAAAVAAQAFVWLPGDAGGAVQRLDFDIALDNVLERGSGPGWPDFFGLGPLREWDEGAWAAKGLLVGGHLRLRLNLLKVF